MGFIGTYVGCGLTSLELRTQRARRLAFNDRQMPAVPAKAKPGSLRSSLEALAAHDTHRAHGPAAVLSLSFGVRRASAGPAPTRPRT